MKPILSGIVQLRSLLCFLLMSSFVSAQNNPVQENYPSGTVPPVLPSNFVSGIKVNYVRSTTLSAPVTTEAAIQPTDYTQTKVQTRYMDGLGRPIQTVDHFASPATNDVVNVVKYDNLGKDVWHFLPYTKAEATASDNGKFKLSAYSDQKDFYKITMGYASDNYFYTQTDYETSPLNRMLRSMAQGNSWVGNSRGVTVTENPLAAGTNVRLFTMAYAPGSLPVTSGVYATADLMVKTTTDEDGYFTEEYTDKSKQLVMKATGKNGNPTKLFTYYVYDDFGLLRAVIPPNASVWLLNHSWTFTSAIFKELCFNYTYDGRLRMVIKDLPGVESQYMVYNTKDEVIFTQTSTQRTKGEWLFNKYDVLGRLIQTGVYTSTSSNTSLQALANVPYTGSDPFLSYLFKDMYGNAAYQSSFSNAKVLTTNYYDDYSFTTRTYNTTYMGSLQAGWNTTKSNETTGMLTGSKTVVLDGAVTPTELLTVNFYNDRGLLLQTQTQNHKGGWNIITHSYDFQGQNQGTYTEINNPQASNNATIKTIESFYYDHAGRLLADFLSLNGQAPVPVIANGLDELGRLDNKNFSNGVDPTIKYEYNVRNWMTAINKEYCLNASTDQTFGMELSYDYGYSSKCYNGNIAGMKWRNSGKGTELRSYGYSYDDYNRLKSGDFVLKTGAITSASPWSNAAKDYTASNITYDQNGNIQSMKHMGMNLAGQKIVLDDLLYAYTPNGNKLQSVSEAGSSQSTNPAVYDGLGDFRDVGGFPDYTYDSDGNLLTDANKGMTYTYDELINKTKRASKAGINVDYLYDAAGTKLQKKVSPGTVTTTDYVGSAVYINNSLSFISHPEGRIRYNASSPTPYMVDYFVKDHLGSTRSVITVTNGAITGFAKSESASSAPSKEVVYLATSEPENAAKEDQLFDNIETTRSANPNKKVQNDNYVAKIYSKNNKTILGPDITLRVMAGDTVKISAEALYIAEKGDVREVVDNAVNNFVTAFSTPVTLAAEGVSTLANNGMNNLATSILNMQNQHAQRGGIKAFLNYVLYDDQMKMIEEGSGALQVQEKDGWQTLETDQIRIPQNGFLRVFSNNQEETPVSMNNTMLTVIPGKLVEEYNYYPYGLVFDQTQASASIKKTDYLYNGKELQHNEFGQGNGLELEDYGARMYDPQLGRWTTPDDYGEITDNESQYCYVGNNPIKRIDPDGNTWGDVIIGIAAAVVDNATGINSRGKYVPAVASDYNAGQNLGDLVSFAAGLIEITVGGGMVGGGTAATVASVGTASPVSVPATAAGAGLIAHGVVMAGRAGGNLITQQGRVDNYSSTTTSSKTNTQTHGNSKSSTKAQTNYRIQDTESGQYVKTGVSGGKKDKNGTPYRANKQANNWNKTEGTNKYKAETVNDVPAGSDARQKALDFEKKDAQLLRDQNQLLDKNKHSRP